MEIANSKRCREIRDISYHRVRWRPECKLNGREHSNVARGMAGAGPEAAALVCHESSPSPEIYSRVRIL